MAVRVSHRPLEEEQGAYRGCEEMP